MDKLIAIALTTALAVTGLSVQADPGSDKDGKHGEWMLKKLDKDDSGTISQDEHRATAMKYFEKFDTDGDGMVSEDEVTAHADERFEKMDTNGDGELDKDELREAKMDHKKMYKKDKGDNMR